VSHVSQHVGNYEANPPFSKYYDAADQEYKGIVVFLARALQQKIEDDGITLLDGGRLAGTVDLVSIIKGGRLLQRRSDDVPKFRRALEMQMKGKLFPL